MNSRPDSAPAEFQHGLEIVSYLCWPVEPIWFIENEFV